MALTLVITAGAGAATGTAHVGRTLHYVASVTNTDVADHTLTTLTVHSPNALISGPSFLAAGALPGVNPTIAAGATVRYPFAVTFTAPTGPVSGFGTSVSAAMTLTGEGQLSDGSVGTGTLAVTVGKIL